MHRTILIPVNDVTNALYISKNELFGDFIATPHNHPCMEIIYFSKGTGKVITTHRELPVKKGDVMIINQGARHFESSKNNDLCFIAIGVKQLEAYLPNAIEKKVLYKSLQSDNAQEMDVLFDLFYKECENKNSSYLKILENIIQMVVSIIQRETEWDFAAQEPASYSHIVGSCKNLIDHYFFEPLSIDALAKRFSISQSRLSHIFKNELGVSIVQYRLMKQLEEADNLLKITNHPIMEIANKVGFSNASYFGKAFKNKYNKTPIEVRNEAKKMLALNEK